MSRVVLAMSGGVDSSVAAWLLKEQGHEVIGLFMRHGLAAADECAVAAADATAAASRRPTKRGCCSAADADDARRVADSLGIPFFALNFEREFGRIIDYFVAEYSVGRTPNPCIVCNTWLKFGKLFEYAHSVGAEYVATGHYARIAMPETGPALLRGVDHQKDQSYVLFGVARPLLGRLMLPVGGYAKSEIRAIAERLGLPVASKPDSQEICFVPDDDHARFVREYRGGAQVEGDIRTTDGRLVGRHPGVEGFTVGQRKGLGVALGDRRYVVRIEPATATVVVGAREELAREELTASMANWLVTPPNGGFRCDLKIRYRSRAVSAEIQPLGADRFVATLAEPCHGVAPGQAAVCYAGEQVLGGGWID
ncbi:MAG: tRNA 2-thiouridine(34) synthase MnmA [Planctomycetota bacterium]